MTQKQWRTSVEWVGVVAGCVVRQNHKYLLVQEANPKVHGLWNVPAGYVDSCETIEATAVRETYEETGYQVELLSKIGVYHDSTKVPVKHAFEAKIVSGTMRSANEEVMSVKWLSFEEIEVLYNNQKLRADWVWDAISTVQNRA